MTLPYDRFETRTPHAREHALFRDFKAIISVAKPRAAALRKQMRGIDLAHIRKREDLARIPVLRRADLIAAQQEEPPFGGYVPTRPSALKRINLVGTNLYAPEGHARDWWGAARALCAAGMGKTDIALNCFSYHLNPFGHMIESGAHMLGCAVIPAGVGELDTQVEVIHHLKPTIYCGPYAWLMALLERGVSLNRDLSSLTKAVMPAGDMSESQRAELAYKGIVAQQMYMHADVGVIAYETLMADGRVAEGMVVNEGIILEIVGMGKERALPMGEIGEVVVTRLNVDCPLVRYATGDLSYVLRDPSPCGRTNMRIKGLLGRVDETALVNGALIHAHQIAAIHRAHPDIPAMRLVVLNMAGRDSFFLQIEAQKITQDFADRLAHNVRTQLGVDVEIDVFVPGTLPHDGRYIRDERSGRG
jgi:phenylacetate-CoA ligase